MGGRSPCGPSRKDLQTVEIDGTDQAPGDDAAASESNVVRIRRDWFGPREELVPFGPSAPEDPPASQPEEGVPRLRDVAASPDAAQAIPPPVRADDFWGEDSASIQNAMRAPEAVGPERVEAEKVEPEKVEAETLGAETLGAETVEPERRELGIAAVKRRGQPGRPRAFAVPVRRIRPRNATAAVAASCLLVMAAIGSFWPGSVRSPQADHPSAGLSPAVIGPVVPPITPRPSRVRRSPHARGTSARRGRGHSRSRARGNGSRSAIAGGSSQSDATPARSTATASNESAQSSPPSSASASPSSGVSSASASPSSGASSTGASSGAGGGNSSGQSTGPEGPGAPFGPGHLG